MQRPSGNPDYRGKTFGSNVASNWGFHYNNLITEPKGREVITIYEVDATEDQTFAKAVYNYRWTPQTRSIRRGSSDHRLPGRTCRQEQHQA